MIKKKLVIAILLFSMLGLVSNSFAQSSDIPDWVKNNADWWSQGLISDRDFATGLAFMVKEGIIEIENVEVNSEGAIEISKDLSIPKWIQNNARWWADGEITDADFKSGIQAMLQEEIISFKEKKPGLATKIRDTSENLSLESSESSIFTDVSETSGVLFLHTSGDYFTNIGGGVAIIDYNNDGWDDIFIPNSVGENTLYQNNKDLTFTDVAKAAGINDPSASAHGACSADYDNDQDSDLFVTGYGTSKLFENNGDGTFIEITKSGVFDPDSSFRTTGCAWGDYDKDGFLDLLLTRWIVQSSESPEAFLTHDFSKASRPLYLFHNNGDGTFTNVTSLLGDVNISPSNVNSIGFQPKFFDYNNDGNLDIFIVNDFGRYHQPNVLWRNDGALPNGDWIFTDVSEPTQTDTAFFGMGVAVGDYDNDEDLDLYITNMGANILLQNKGDFFANETLSAGVSAEQLVDSVESESSIEDSGSMETGMEISDFTEVIVMEEFQNQNMMNIPIAWGTIFFDYDNDGFLDLYVVRGHMSNEPLMNTQQPNKLFRNNGDGSFLDVSHTSGIDDPGFGRGVAYADFNNDGCLDIYLVNIDQMGKLFVNNCDSKNNFLVIDTIGTESNTDGIGARIKVVTDSGIFTREVTSGGSHISQNMLQAHFGLGESSEVSLIEIIWPSGIVQELIDIPANQILTVTER